MKTSKNYINLLVNCKLLQVIKTIFLLTVVGLYSCHKAIVKEEVSIEIHPYVFKIYGKQEAIKKELESKRVFLQYQDSHVGSDKGVSLDYFGAKENSINYYVELYSHNQKLEGVKATLYSEELNNTDFF